MCIVYTVEPPLLATTLHQPLFFVPAESPYVHSCFNLLQWAPVHRAEATRIRLGYQKNLLTTAS